MRGFRCCKYVIITLINTHITNSILSVYLRIFIGHPPPFLPRVASLFLAQCSKTSIKIISLQIVVLGVNVVNMKDHVTTRKLLLVYVKINNLSILPLPQWEAPEIKKNLFNSYFKGTHWHKKYSFLISLILLIFNIDIFEWRSM